MMSGEECVFKNSQIEKVYSDIIKEQLVDESNYLLKNLPIENINIDINKNGLMKIDYSISEKKIKIDMEYDGGLTEIKLERINNDVRRTIIYEAD